MKKKIKNSRKVSRELLFIENNKKRIMTNLSNKNNLLNKRYSIKPTKIIEKNTFYLVGNKKFPNTREGYKKANIEIINLLKKGGINNVRKKR